MVNKTFISTILFFFSIGILFSQQSKIVLIEEGTGTWCAWCPEGKVFSNELLRDYAGEMIFIEVHSQDPMANEEYRDSSRFPFFPSGHVNRKKKDLETNQWEVALIRELLETPPANINLEITYDTLSRNLKVNVAAEFFKTLTGDYRLSAIVIEDAVTGDNESYNQKNVFANDVLGSMGGYEDLPASIPHDIMVYDHVGRHLLGGYGGAAESLPAQAVAGNTYTHSFDWTLPIEYDEAYIWVAALMINNENGQVINAGKSNYILGNKNAKPFFVSNPLTEAHKDLPFAYNIRYHDPDHNFNQIEIIEPIPSWLSFEKERSGFAVLKGIPEKLETYDVTLRLTDTEYSIDQTFQIVVKDSIPPTITTLKNDFLILPNPNEGVFTLEFDRGSYYQIFDGLGKVIAEEKLLRNINNKQFSQPINIQSANTGLYFMKVFDNGQYVKTKKLFISKK